MTNKQIIEALKINGTYIRDWAVGKYPEHDLFEDGRECDNTYEPISITTKQFES